MSHYVTTCVCGLCGVFTRLLLRLSYTFVQHHAGKKQNVHIFFKSLHQQPSEVAANVTLALEWEAPQRR